MVIQHNLSAFNTNRQLGMVTKKISQSAEKLSSGYKINRAADDAAGLSISEKMRKQIRGLQKASENIEDGISLVQVADGALNETTDILQRMNELSIQAANGTNSANDRKAIQMEIDQLCTEINRIANTTSFNQSVYPLKSVGYYYPGNDEYIPGINAPTASPIAPKPLDDIDISQGCIHLNGLSGYPSYVDADGKTHYVLGSGKYEITNVSNCVIDVSGNVTLANTNLTNVTIDCAAGTSLSVSNVKIDNSAHTTSTTGGIGAAVTFHGAGNTLNCYNKNEFNGGMDSYKIFTDSLNNVPYHIAGSGIHVESSAKLTINGTNSSTLIAHGCDTNEWVSYGNEASRIDSNGIGSNFHEDGGTIVINSGTINAYTNIAERTGMGSGCIGGGNNTNITINGGNVNAYGGTSFAIGGGDTFGDSMQGHGTAKITINGGTIHAEAHNAYAAIGFDGEGSIDIYGGDITAYGSADQSIGIGNSGSNHVNGNTGTVSIHGGNILAVSEGTRGVAIGSYTSSVGSASNGTVRIDGGVVTAKAKSGTAIGPAATFGTVNGTVNVYVDGKLTDASGTSDGIYSVYTYNNPNTKPEVSGGNTSGRNTQLKRDDGVWIQSTNEALKGLYIKLVDASMGGLFNGAQNISVLTEKACDRSVIRVSNALKKVNEYRSYFGAIQNRMEHAYQNNENVIENTTHAESQIRDTDMTEEMVRYSNYNILSQSGQSMLAQANQRNQAVLSLLA